MSNEPSKFTGSAFSFTLSASLLLTLTFHATPAVMKCSEPGDCRARITQSGFLPSSLAPGEPWRHNQAGDLIADRNGNIDSTKLRLLAWANRGKLGITYTHHDVLNNAHNRQVIQEAIADGFTVNLSADTIEEADAF